MKKLIVIMSLIMVVGCSVNQVFVNGVDGYTRIILPEYKEYIKGDASITQDSKRIRIQTADRLQELIEEAKENK